MLKKTSALLTNLTKSERLLFGGAALVFAASALFIGWRLYVSRTTLVPARGGAYSEGMIGQPALINPTTATSDIDQDLTALLFANLLQLSQSYAVSADHLLWTVTLKKNLRWDDGQKLTADDILFTLNIIQDPNTNSPLSNDWQAVSAERINENEIRFRLKEPYAFFIDNLRQFRPLPKHIFGAIPVTNFRLSGYNLEPVGSGPYRFAGFNQEKNGFITAYRLAANPAFSGGAPFIEDFTILFFNTSDDLIAALNRRQIMAAGGLDAAAVTALNAEYQIIKINIPRYYALFFNLSDPSPLLKDREARRLLARAIDKEAIIAGVFKNGAMVIDGPIFPALEGYRREPADDQPLDPDQARKSIETAFASSTRELNVVVPQIPFLIDAVRAIRESWIRLGVRLNFIAADPAEVAQRYIKTRNYQLLLYGVILKANPDVYPFWHSAERFYPGLNLSLYNSKNADLLLEAIRKEHTGSIREAKLAELQTAIRGDQPAIFLFSPNYFYVTDKRLRGFTTTFLAAAPDRFAEINRWHLKTRRKFK